MDKINKEEDMSDLKNYGTATIKYIQENGSRDMELIIPYNQEIVNINGRYILKDKKPKYPTTYEECCDILKIDNNPFRVCTLMGEPVLAFVKLIVARNTYWKMADNWKPDYTNDTQNKPCIQCFNGIVEKNNVIKHSRVLIFPTAEMRDAFYENFKELIEQCKELL